MDFQIAFKPHLQKAHQFWKELLCPTDSVIDATCGNGKDTAVLAGLVPQGHVYAIDIQEDAIEKAKQNVVTSNVTFLHQSHRDLPEVQGIKLVVYNLGYLPGGNKEITTTRETTLESAQLALTRLIPGGALTITCYPGHLEGEIEEKTLQKWSSYLSPGSYVIKWSSWRPRSPTLLIVCKLKYLD